MPERAVPRFPTVLSTKRITEQHHKPVCNINSIMARYNKTGLLPITSRLAQFADVSGVTTYHEAVEKCREVNNLFAELPSAVRKEFRNDPGELIQFLSDENNREKAIELGLIERPVVDNVSPESPEVPAGS